MMGQQMVYCSKGSWDDRGLQRTDCSVGFKPLNSPIAKPNTMYVLHLHSKTPIQVSREPQKPNNSLLKPFKNDQH